MPVYASFYLTPEEEEKMRRERLIKREKGIVLTRRLLTEKALAAGYTLSPEELFELVDESHIGFLSEKLFEEERYSDEIRLNFYGNYAENQLTKYREKLSTHMEKHTEEDPKDISSHKAE